MADVVNIARCPEHGLHGERDECFVCGGEVEQVAMVSEAEVERLKRLLDQRGADAADAEDEVERLRDLLQQAVACVASGRISQIGTSRVYTPQVNVNTVERWATAVASRRSDQTGKERP